MVNRNIKALIVTGLVLLLLNCASSPVKVVDPLVQSQTHGYVVGSLIASSTSMIPIDHTGVVLEGENGELFHLTAPGNFRQTKQVSGWLPEGNYRLVRFYKGNLNFSESIQTLNAGAFDIAVKAGEVMDLNHLIPIDLGKKKGVLLSVPRTQEYTADVVGRYPDLYPNSAIKSWVDKSPITEGKSSSGNTYNVGFIPSLILAYGERLLLAKKVDLFDGSTSHAEAFDVIKHYGIPSTQVKTDSKGNSYFGTQMGQIRYQQDDKWHVMSTGYIEAVVALDISSDSIVVGLESGKLIKTTDRGKTWAELFTLNDGEFVFETLTVGGTRFVGAWMPDKSGNSEVRGFRQMIEPELVLYEVVDNRLVEIHRVVAGKLGAYFQGLPQLGVLNGKVYISLVPKTLLAYDIASKTIAEIVTPKNFAGLSINSKKGFITTWFAGGLFSNAFYSKDAGESWEKLPKPPYQPRYIHNDSPDPSYMWSMSIGMNSTAFQLDQMNAKSNKWDKLTKTKVNCRRLLSNFVKNEHYCMYSSGVIKTFSDGKWLD